MKHVLALGVCALFIACGSSGDNSVNTGSVSNADPKAAGSAYNVTDTMPSARTAAALPAAAETTVAGEAPAAAPDAPANETVAAVAAKPAVADDSADIKRGEALISKSDCFACHKVQDKLLGPSYKEVADKYPNNPATIAQLVAKIKEGGSGVWGPIPMSPHPGLSDDDGQAMVKYIMSLK